MHVVTQIVTSTLGLIVFPWERMADLKIRGTSIATLEELGWPKWAETKPSKGMGQLIRNLRNALAHGNVQFSSDYREAASVIVSFRSENGDWQATILAHDLKSFCLKFIDFIDQAIG